MSSDEQIAFSIKNENPKRQEDFQKHEAQLQMTIASWREETDGYLTSLIPQPSAKGKKKAPCNDAVNPLELATTFFKCHWCTEPISYPRVLMHSCFARDPRAVNQDDDDDSEEEVVVDYRRIPRQPRLPKQITYDSVLHTMLNQHTLGMRAGMEGVAYDDEASKAVRKIIVLCGKDANTVTYAAMEEADARIECLRCSRAMHGRHKRLIMKWTMAVRTHFELLERLSLTRHRCSSSMSSTSIMMNLPHPRRFGARSNPQRSLKRSERWKRR